MQGVHPDHSDDVEQSREEFGDGAGGGAHKLLARLAQQGDEFQTVLCLVVAVLEKRGMDGRVVRVIIQRLVGTQDWGCLYYVRTHKSVRYK